MDAFSANPVLPIQPLTAIIVGAFNRVPLMLGTVKYDGALFKELLHTLAPNSTEVNWAKLATLLSVSRKTQSNMVTKEEELKTQVLAKFSAGNLQYQFNQGQLCFGRGIHFLCFLFLCNGNKLKAIVI